MGGALVWHTAEECVFVGISVIDFEPGFCSTGEAAVVLVKTNVEDAFFGGFHIFGFSSIFYITS